MLRESKRRLAEQTNQVQKTYILVADECVRCVRNLYVYSACNTPTWIGEEYQGAAVTRDITKQTDQKTGPDDKPQGLLCNVNVCSLFAERENVVQQPGTVALG
jgi:hypothetical protein